MALFYTCFLLGAVLLMAGNVMGNCNRGTVNGCSVGNKFPYKETFRPACNRHDVCYGCGAKFGVRKRTCDLRFLVNMAKICRTKIGWTKARCASMAAVYFKGVETAGVFFYHYFNPESYCDQSWVKGCL